MKEFIRQNKEKATKLYAQKKWFRISIGAIAGGLAGYAYWRFIGCNGGTCPLTSNPYQSVFFFSLFGGIFVADSPSKKKDITE